MLAILLLMNREWVSLNGILDISFYIISNTVHTYGHEPFKENRWNVLNLNLSLPILTYWFHLPLFFFCEDSSVVYRRAFLFSVFYLHFWSCFSLTVSAVILINHLEITFQHYYNYWGKHGMKFCRVSNLSRRMKIFIYWIKELESVKATALNIFNPKSFLSRTAVENKFAFAKGTQIASQFSSFVFKDYKENWISLFRMGTEARIIKIILHSTLYIHQK